MYQKAAEQGFANAEFELALMFLAGRGVEQNESRAAVLLNRAAGKGVARAQLALAGLYDRGEGVKQDFAQAADWYREAALQGAAEAQLNLGIMYENGQGVPQDCSQAADLYRLAANQGNATAQFNLGLLYDNGNGVEKDFAQPPIGTSKLQSRAFLAHSSTLARCTHKAREYRAICQKPISGWIWLLRHGMARISGKPPLPATRLRYVCHCLI